MSTAQTLKHRYNAEPNERGTSIARAKSATAVSQILPLRPTTAVSIVKHSISRAILLPTTSFVCSNTTVQPSQAICSCIPQKHCNTTRNPKTPCTHHCKASSIQMWLISLSNWHHMGLISLSNWHQMWLISLSNWHHMWLISLSNWHHLWLISLSKWHHMWLISLSKWHYMWLISLSNWHHMWLISLSNWHHMRLISLSNWHHMWLHSLSNWHHMWLISLSNWHHMWLISLSNWHHMWLISLSNWHHNMWLISLSIRISSVLSVPRKFLPNFLWIYMHNIYIQLYNYIILYIYIETACFHCDIFKLIKCLVQCVGAWDPDLATWPQRLNGLGKSENIQT